VRTFAAWGVDYIKLDWCNADYGSAAATAITRQWRAAIVASGRPMILSINAGGSPTVASWAHTVANSWRIGGDVCGSWYNQSRPAPPTARRCYHDRRYHMGIADYLDAATLRQEALYAGPGHYLDPDMLEVGTAPEVGVGRNLPGYALTLSEAETSFSMWAMWSAPLIAGNDPGTMNGQDPASRILLNRGIIAIDADPTGRPADLIEHRGTWQVWRKALSGGRVALAVVNLGDRPGRSFFSWAPLRTRHRPAKVTDVWSGRRLRVRQGLAVSLPAHGTGVYLLSWRHS
jgi:alpha-galactosidase